jgi:hypothetical protein
MSSRPSTATTCLYTAVLKKLRGVEPTLKDVHGKEEVGKVVPRETVHVHEHLDKMFLCD